MTEQSGCRPRLPSYRAIRDPRISSQNAWFSGRGPFTLRQPFQSVMPATGPALYFEAKYTRPRMSECAVEGVDSEVRAAGSRRRTTQGDFTLLGGAKVTTNPRAARMQFTASVRSSPERTSSQNSGAAHPALLAVGSCGFSESADRRLRAIDVASVSHEAGTCCSRTSQARRRSLLGRGVNGRRAPAFSPRVRFLRQPRLVRRVGEQLDEGLPHTR